jgi:hypothetical protein
METSSYMKKVYTFIQGHSPTAKNVLIHTAQEKFATFKQNELSTLLKPTLLN